MQRSSGNLLGIVFAVVVVAVMLLIFIPAFVMVGSGGSIMFAPLCGIFVVILIILLVTATQGARQTQLPPPPPIQQPMVPAGMQGPVALSCPNCGAPPSLVDRFGVATCPYCGTRFLVR